MGKSISWIERAKRRDVWTAVRLGWAFLAIPAALVATKVDDTLGWIALGVAAAPIIVMALLTTALIVLGPFFARKRSERLILAPISLFIGYAMDEWQGALLYLAAVLTVWAAVSAITAYNAGKVRLPS